MKKFLVDAMESSKLIALYVNKEDSEEFIVGKVALVGERDILAVLYDTKNMPEALCYCVVDAIYRIEQDSLYLRHIQEYQHIEFAFSEFEGPPWDSFFQMQSRYVNYALCHLKSGELFEGKVIQHSQYAVVLSQTKNNKMSQCVTSFDRSEVAMLTVDIANGGV